MEKYIYKPLKFYSIVFTFTWFFWIVGIFLSYNGNNDISMLFMLLGLFVPAFAALSMIIFSRNATLKNDFKKKIFGFYRIHPFNILEAISIFAGIVVISVLVSLLFEQSIEQLSFTEDFSFSIKGCSALIIILLASIIEEVGWRGYGEDSVAYYCSWFKESIIFGVIWSMWHLPLFFIEGSYQYGLLQLGIVYAINFIISVIPLGFITTWVYVKNNRSMLSCIIFHIFVNFMQEKIALTPQTKCVETFVIIVAAVMLVCVNKKMFFERKHIGKLLENTK